MSGVKNPSWFVPGGGRNPRDVQLPVGNKNLTLPWIGYRNPVEADITPNVEPAMKHWPLPRGWTMSHVQKKFGFGSFQAMLNAIHDPRIRQAVLKNPDRIPAGTVFRLPTALFPKPIRH